ncbi:uncharacterized protein LOC130818153 [Amaranthus tricolor]|uniref:uncharacterized protein LOC130818153 n=1 Tax=Amaranthus tricolor TaxID=29722 RepID=UPI002583DBD7|nr:uncharacterized protein LOC130818153 [Amaranthus tricolor]
MGSEINGHFSNLFEDSWFFGNSLLRSSKSSKTMVRCNSDPCSSSSSNDQENMINHDQDPLKKSNLLRTPSLPLCFDHNDDDNDEQHEDEDEHRMGDLIRQAMPMPVPMTMTGRRLDRTPSLPPCRGKDAMKGHGLVLEKGPIAIAKLTRRASIDSSLLPPKSSTSKGTKPSTSNQKNRSQRKLEPSSINSAAKTEIKPQKLDRSKSQKSLSDLEIEELQGFKDLGFRFDSKDTISPSVKQVIPALQRRASLDSNNKLSVTRPYLSESWKSPSSPSSAPLVPKRKDEKVSSSDDMKAQIKFWARAVASNVRQEC